ncbi:MAG: AmmeMemoRadiSam system protein A [Casimicrobiaceae bacterium]
MSRADIGGPLLALARGAIAEQLGMSSAPAPIPDDLTQIGATFVTLRSDGDLRGCIGTVDAWRPLADDVRANAVAAAFRDPRFSPLRRNELGQVSIEVSLLNPSEPLPSAQEASVAATLRPGIDGVVLECARHRATFLPQVWEQLPHPSDFLRALKRKAGLLEDFWSDDIRVSRYTVEKFVEGAP